MPQCLVRHDGAQVGAADTNIDNVANPFAAAPLPRAAADAIGKRTHGLEHLVDGRHHIDAVQQDY